MLRRKYQYGNTIRFKCEFFDFDNSKADPQIIKFIIYDERYNVVFQENGATRLSEGEYIFDYTTPERKGKYYYEWYGEVDGKPSIKRGEFKTDFV